MSSPFLSRSKRQFFVFAVFAATLSLRGQSAANPGGNAPVALDDYVISATRSAQELRASASAVSVVSLPDLAVAQIPELRTALSREPGVAIVATGTPGGQTSVFLRGASSHQTLFVVDGVRMNDRAASYTNFFGGADLVGVDRLEVLRGPQSTLYGSSAMGGVILMEMLPGEGQPSGALAATAGSFETWGGSATVRGSRSDLGYVAQLGRFETANDVPHNDFESWSYASRLDLRATERLNVGATFRGFNSTFEENGSRLFPSPGEVKSDNYLGTLFAEAVVTNQLRSRLTVAQHERRYEFTAPWGVSEQRNRRRIADWLNTWTPSEQAEVVGGLNYERSRYLISGAATTDEVMAAHVSSTLRPTAAGTVTGGVRYDDYDSFGDATTWRIGTAWRLTPTTKLRGTIGTGFSAPGSDDRYGVPAWGQLPSPDLAAEKSRGWDIGVDHELGDGRATVSATYFHNRFRNLFEWTLVDPTTFSGRIMNRARAESDGLEFAAAGRLAGPVRARVAYTYLEAKDTLTGERLVRRPRHTADAEIRWEATPAWILGTGVHFVGGRLDVGTTMDDYTTARVFGSYAPRADLTLKLRVENAFDEAYEEVLGYPALPRGAFGSIEWRF